MLMSCLMAMQTRRILKQLTTIPTLKTLNLLMILMKLRMWIPILKSPIQPNVNRL